MARDISAVISFVMDLEHLLNERDEWLASFGMLSLKRDILRKYGDVGEDLQEAVQDLDDKASKAESLFDGVAADLSKYAGTADPEEARSLLIKLKSLLNAYAEQTGREFVQGAGLEDMSADDIVTFGCEMITNG